MAKYQCPNCEYTYDETLGHPHEGFPAGTPWSKVPNDFSCPDCAVRDKEDFVLIDAAPSPSAATSRIEPAPPTPVPTPKPMVAAPAAPQSPGPDPVAQIAPTAGTIYRKWICITCGHIYDEALGDDHEGFPPGTLFSQIPDDWCCPDCGASKEDYVLYEER
ncbi:MAG: rubredoxin [Rhizobium sp.]|jgi:rubredoxin|nr:rubredoxin [Rhizobium sp.]